VRKLEQGTTKPSTKHIWSKQGRVWSQLLHKGLTGLGYIQSKIDPCFYYRSVLDMINYTYVCIIASEKSSILQEAIVEISKKFEITEESEVDEYLG
jgi:hypothetical protein